MEKERLASLGQMVGGIAHNLKTPIMSIAGAATAMENLVNECQLSRNNLQVTKEDYDEIYKEMIDWIVRTKERLFIHVRYYQCCQRSSYQYEHFCARGIQF